MKFWITILLTLFFSSSHEEDNQTNIDMNKPCTEDDIKSYLTLCDNSNHRNILFYLQDSVCNNVNQLAIPKMKTNVECGFKCNHGEYLTYNQSSEGYQCVKCPNNTFSYGGDFRITGESHEWKEDFVERIFHRSCYVSDNSEGSSSQARNTNCTSWSVDQEEYLISGSTNIAQVFYFSELIYNVQLKSKGSIEFGYTKTTHIDSNAANGQVTFFIDNEKVYSDSNVNKNIQVVNFTLNQGHHTFAWVYSYKTVNDDAHIQEQVPDMKMKLRYLLVTGLDDAAYQCTPCMLGFSGEGADHCTACAANFYYDLSSTQCLPCGANQFSFPNSYHQSSCKEKSPCTAYDMKESHGMCIEGKRNVSYELDNPVICDNSSYAVPSIREEICLDECEIGFYREVSNDNQSRCVGCPNGYYSNKKSEGYSQDKCDLCQDGSYSPKSAVYNKFHNMHLKSSFGFDENKCSQSDYNHNPSVCEIVKGWRSANDRLTPGSYLPSGIELTLSKKFHMLLENAYVTIEYEIVLLQNHEEFYISIDGNKENNLDMTPGHRLSKKFYLPEGPHNITLGFTKPQGGSPSHTPLFIYSLEFFGSTEGGSSDCVSCPDGTVRKSSDLDKIKCYTCQDGYIPNQNRSECVLNQTIEDSSIVIVPDDEGTENVETSCPDFAIYDEGNKKCKVLDIIHNKKHYLKFHLNELMKEVKTICNENSEICYMKFVGPIADNVQRDLYFMSLAEKDIISITDFSYIMSNDTICSGYFYALFDYPESKKYFNFAIHVNNSYARSSKVKAFNTPEVNIKLFKNIGSKLGKILIMPGMYYKNSSLANGIIMNFTDGDRCIDDPSQSFSSYIFINCDTTGSYSGPIFYGKTNHNCTLLFEWSTRFGCPICRTAEIEGIKEGCFGGKQNVHYTEAYNCIITDRAHDIDQDRAKHSKVEFNSKDNIVTENLFLRDNVMQYYYASKFHWEVSAIASSLNYSSLAILENLSISDHEIYVESKIEESDCNESYISHYTSSKYGSIILIIVVPIAYFVTTLCLVWLYCKYVKVTSEYQRLRQDQEKEITGGVSIEMEIDKTATDNEINP